MRVISVLVSAALALTLSSMPTEGASAEADMQPCRDAPATQVTTDAVFSNPAAGDPSAIVRQICNLVHQTPNNARIRIAHFVISGDVGMDFATELVDAHRRGVDVQLVLDGWQVDNPAVDVLRAGLGTDESQRSWLHVCTGLSPEGTAPCAP